MGHEVHARLYVCAGADADPQQVAAWLDAAGAATLLIMAPSGGALTAAAARPLLELAQKKDVAALIDGDAQLARTLRADGVHLPWSKDVAPRYAEAREILATRNKLNRMYMEHTGQPLDVIEQSMDRDKFFSPEEAKSFGLIDDAGAVVAGIASARAAMNAGKSRRSFSRN